MRTAKGDGGHTENMSAGHWFNQSIVWMFEGAWNVIATLWKKLFLKCCWKFRYAPEEQRMFFPYEKARKMTFWWRSLSIVCKSFKELFRKYWQRIKPMLLFECTTRGILKLFVFFAQACLNKTTATSMRSDLIVCPVHAELKIWNADADLYELLRHIWWWFQLGPEYVTTRVKYSINEGWRSVCWVWIYRYKWIGGSAKFEHVGYGAMSEMPMEIR